MVLDDVQRGVDLETFSPCLLEGKLVQLRKHATIIGSACCLQQHSVLREQLSGQPMMA